MKWLGVLALVAGCWSQFAYAEVTRFKQLDEVWICQMPESWSPKPVVTRYWLRETLLLSMDQNLPNLFYVLLNDDVAIIAVNGFGIAKQAESLPGGGGPVIESATFLINRLTGETARGGVTLYGNPVKTVHGSCHQQRPDDPDGVWPSGFIGERDMNPKGK